MFTINGVEFEFNILNARTADAWEKAFAELDEVGKQPAAKGLAAEIRRQTAAVHKLLDAILGEGSYEATCLDPDDLNANMDAVEALIAEGNRQKDATGKRWSKYAPNRAQRRAT